jgi:hypothetical protein
VSAEHRHIEIDALVGDDQITCEVVDLVGDLRLSGGGRIRTCEGRANGFTVRPL